MEELEILAPMIVTVTLILVVGAVVLLKPVSRKLENFAQRRLRKNSQVRLSNPSSKRY